MRLHPRRQSGLSLIELLVAVTIGLFATLAITQSFVISGAHRRTATSGGDAAFNSALGQYTIQRDARMAGYGINHPMLLGCRVIAYDEGVSPPRTFDFFLAPVVITQGAGTAPDAITITYSSTDTLPAPIVNRYYIAGNELRLDPLISNTIGARVAPEIVQLQAQYGRDADGDGIVDTWTDATPATAVEWSRTLALRFALVARSALPEREREAAGVCTTTTAPPTWAGGTLDVTALPDWRCYRYRVFESTTSLRNLIWRPA